MKYSQSDALKVVHRFEQYLSERFNIKNYAQREFFHEFEITPLTINGRMRSRIRFKDDLIRDTLQSGLCAPDINELIDTCLI